MKGEFYKMEYDAWDQGTVELSLEEEGAYLRLCHQIYRMHGPILNSDRLLSSLWRCHKNKARPLLQRLVDKGKIQITEDGRLTNERTTIELEGRKELGKQRAIAGHIGGTRSAQNRALKTGHVHRTQGTRAVHTGDTCGAHIGDGSDNPLKLLDTPQAKSSREEEIREEERREKSIEGANAPKRVRSRKTETPMPDIFPMSDQHRQYAASRGYTGASADHLFERFKNHHQSKDNKFANWDAAWRSWVGNQVQFDGQRNQGGQQRGMDPRL